MAEKSAYSQATLSGKYDKTTGLLGKYDNVRVFWEDQVSRIFFRPSLNDLVEYKRKRLDRIRVLDMGCGSGDGYDLIMGITTKDPAMYEYITQAITPDMLDEYVGLDINENLLKQATDYYGVLPKVRFMQGDMSEGLPEKVKQEDPFDVYFTSFGTLSHFHDQQNAKLIADVCRHAPERALFVGDWLGRYSYEWQDLWDKPVDEEYFMDYRISYIYPAGERKKRKVDSFPLRLTTRDEIMKIVQQASSDSGVEIRPLVFYDRSLLIGRHMDTGEYNRHCPEIRRAVNSLFEGYVRTDLETLIVDYVPRQGFGHLNNFFEMFFMSCNALVDYTISLLSEYDSDAKMLNGTQEIHSYYPEPLKEVMHTMRKMIEGVGWVRWGDVRANVIEPNLGFSLRELEMKLQPGTGNGHSLVGIFEVRK